MALTNLELAHTRCQALDQLIASRTDRHRDRNRHAPLTRRTVGRAKQCVAGRIHIRIRHHHHVILGTAQGLHAFAVGTTCRVDMLSHGGRTHKTHGLDLWMRQERIDDGSIALHDVEDPIGQTRLLQQTRHDEAG